MLHASRLTLQLIIAVLHPPVWSGPVRSDSAVTTSVFRIGSSLCPECCMGEWLEDAKDLRTSKSCCENVVERKCWLADGCVKGVLSWSDPVRSDSAVTASVFRIALSLCRECRMECDEKTPRIWGHRRVAVKMLLRANNVGLTMIVSKACWFGRNCFLKLIDGDHKMY